MQHIQMRRGYYLKGQRTETACPSRHSDKTQYFSCNHFTDLHQPKLKLSNLDQNWAKSKPLLFKISKISNCSLKAAKCSGSLIVSDFGDSYCIYWACELVLDHAISSYYPHPHYHQVVQPCTQDGYTRVDVKCGCADCYCWYIRTIVTFAELLWWSSSCAGHQNLNI